MKIRGIVSEDFVNYKYPSTFISMGTCDWKCCKEQNIDISICQNSELAKAPEKDFSDLEIINSHLLNPITSAIVIGGLEPFTYFDDLYKFICRFRKKCSDEIVIYTGYNPEEIIDELYKLVEFNDIIIKFGRYMPGQEKHKDKVLGVNLASDNQFAIKLNKEFLEQLKEFE